MKEEAGIHIRNILLGSLIFLYVLLLAPNLPESYRILIKGNAILLSSIYFVLLIISLYLYKGSTKVAVYIFFLLSLIFYAQRIVFLYIFPESIRYARTVNYTTSDINTALLYLLICTIAVFIGFKAGEFIPLKKGNSKESKWLPKWMYSESSRMKFYIVSLCVYLIRIIMSVYYQHTAEGALLNTRITQSFVMKLVLHLLFYFNFVQLIIFIILLHPDIRRKTKENITILIIFALLMLTSLSQGSKAAVISIALSYFVVKIMLENYTFKKKTLALVLIIMLTFPVMAPLSVSVRTSIILGVKSMDQFSRIFKKASQGYIDDLIANSSRLGGVDWLAVAVSEDKKDELRGCVNPSSLGEDAARRLIPVPNLFPDKPNMLQKYTTVVWKLPREEISKVTELPTFLGVTYLLFGYFAFFVVFLWGMISVIVMRSNISLVLKVLFFQHLVIQLFLGGDIVESVKAFFMAVFILWLIKLAIAPGYKLEVAAQKGL